jgi:hypothetical protein
MSADPEETRTQQATADDDPSEEVTITIETLEGPHLVECTKWAGAEVLGPFLETLEPHLAARRLLEATDEHGSNVLHVCAGLDDAETALKIRAVMEGAGLTADQISDWGSSANAEGNTPLHWASVTASLRMVRCLCADYGVRTAVENLQGRTPLCEAQLHQRQNVLDLFIDLFGTAD